MKRIAVVLVVAIAADCAPPGKDDAAARPRLARTIVLPRDGGGAESGRFDHLAYDPKTHRLFIAAVTHGSLEVVDLEAGKSVASLRGLRTPLGTAFAAGTGRVAVTCAGEGMLRLYDARTLQEAGRTPVEDPDNVRYAAGRLYVAFSSGRHGGIAVFDEKKLTKVAELRLDGHPESFQLTPDAKRVFVNVPRSASTGAATVVAGNLETGKIESTWRLPDAGGNYPMAFDAKRHRLFVGARRPARLVCLDARTGRVLGKASCVSDSDDIFADEKSGHAFVIGGGGSIDVFSIADDGTPARIARVETARRARTGLLVPERRALYVPVPARGNHAAEVREYLLPE